MVMDPHLHDHTFPADDFNFETHNPLLDPDLTTNNGFKSKEPAVGVDSFVVPHLSIGPDAYE